MTINQVSFPFTAMLLIGLTACSPAKQAIDPTGETFAAVAPDEVITLTETEPFWAAKPCAGAAILPGSHSRAMQRRNGAVNTS